MCLAKHPSAKELTNSSSDWLTSNVHMDWCLTGNGYVTLSQSWEKFKYISFVNGHAGGGHAGLSVTTVDIDAMKAQKAYIDSTTVGATYTNTVMNLWVGEICIDCGSCIGQDYTYVHFYRTNYSNRYDSVSSTTLHFYSNAMGNYFVYGHNTL